MKRFLFLSGLLVTVLTFMACDNSTDPNGNGDDNGCATLAEGEDVKITYPAGGETFNYGDTVKIAFTVAKGIDLVNIAVSVDSGRIYRNIPKKDGVDVESKGDVGCTEYSWVIGDEGELVDYAANNTNCMIKVEAYTDPETSGRSKTFTIIKN